MLRKILTYPNAKLFVKSKPVTEFNKDLHILLDDMYETMVHYNGVGLAAIQVGVDLQIFIANIGQEDEETLLEVINPKITPLNTELIEYNEGCLSVPDFFEMVQRPSEILLSFQDRFGQNKEFHAKDYQAIVLQHENDHLNGHLFIEKINYLKRQKFDKEFKKKLKNEKAKMR